MSRSMKKTPVGGITTSESEKFDKKKWHRKLRKKSKQMLTSTRYDEAELEQIVLPEERDVSDTWSMSKDGKVYFGEGPAYRRMGENRYISMATEWIKKLMRK